MLRSAGGLFRKNECENMWQYGAFQRSRLFEWSAGLEKCGRLSRPQDSASDLLVLNERCFSTTDTQSEVHDAAFGVRVQFVEHPRLRLLRLECPLFDPLMSGHCIPWLPGSPNYCSGTRTEGRRGPAGADQGGGGGTYEPTSRVRVGGGGARMNRPRGSG